MDDARYYVDLLLLMTAPSGSRVPRLLPSLHPEEPQ
jgi:hypothetical protein